MIDWCAERARRRVARDRRELDGQGRGVRGAVPSRRPLRAGDGRRPACRSDTIVEQVFREIRAFRIYDGPTEVHKWSLAKKIKRDLEGSASMSRADDNAGTIPVRADPPLRRAPRLTRWMAANVAGFSRPARRRAVQRRPVQPDLQARQPRREPMCCAASRRAPLLKGAHAVEREAQGAHGAGARRLSRCRTSMGCARTTASSAPGSMSWTWSKAASSGTRPSRRCTRRPRRVFRCDERDDRATAHASITEHRALATSAGRATISNARSRAGQSNISTMPMPAAMPHMDRLIDWLPANIPAGDETRIVHGDFRMRQYDLSSHRAASRWPCSTGSCPRWAIRSPISPITR